ncbi:MAG: M67 family metallopeptidase [Anaerolineales bacterium]|nr:M67 family metallopeptidase [Anaerolineales bacterium]
MVAHAREGKPEEICGVVRGRAGVALEVVRGRNIAAERVENYEVDPATLLLQFTFEDAGDEMIAIYHSHPVSVAYPSATDAWNANYPESIYLICSLEFDDAPVIRGFCLEPHFIDFDLETLRAQLPFYETRPGLFAYFQDVATPVPAALADVAIQVPAPFYVDFFVDDAGALIDSRIVAIAECDLADS